MPHIEARYQKPDKFGNSIFIVSEKYEPLNFKILAKYSNKLTAKGYDSFLPIFNNTVFKYCTIRFKNAMVELECNATYAINFTIKEQARDGKTYVNCYTKSVKLVKPAPSLGDDINLDSDSDSE